MSISLGIYDVFAYVLPGLLYLYFYNEVLKLLHQSYIDINQLKEIGYIFLVGVLAYLVGHLMDFVAHRTWIRLLKPPVVQQEAINIIKEAHPELGIKFEAKDWNVLGTFLRMKSPELSRGMDEPSAIGIMLRNISFGLFLLSIFHFILFFVNSFAFINLALFVFCFAFSLIAFRRSLIFSRRYHIAIFESALAYGNSLDDVLRNARKSNGTTTNKDDASIGANEYQ